MDTIQKYLHHTRIAIWAIVGFLALLVYLIIVMSQQISGEQALRVDSRAYEGGYAAQYAQQMMQNNGDGQSSGNSVDTTSQTGQTQDTCYEIKNAASGGSLGRGYCRFTVKCNAYKDGVTDEILKAKLEEMLRAKYSVGVTCTIGGDGIKCSSSNRSCTDISSALKLLLEQYCVRPGQTYCNVPPTPTPTPAPEVQPQNPPVIPPADPGTGSQAAACGTFVRASVNYGARSSCANPNEVYSAMATCKLDNKTYYCNIYKQYTGSGGVACIQSSELTDEMYAAACCHCSPGGAQNYYIPANP